MAVTSAQARNHALELGTDSLAARALPKRSWVRLDKVFTLSEGSTIKAFGTVTLVFFHDVLDGFCRRAGYPAA
jgi:hypothetical protein